MSPGAGDERRPKQERSQRTQQALLDAAAALVAERGCADFTLAEVAEHAGLTTGAIYARFRDREDLLLALYARFVAESKERTTRLFEELLASDDDLKAAVRAYVTANLRSRSRRANLRNAFLTRIHRDPAFAELSRSLHRHLAEGMSALIQRHRPRLGKKAADRAGGTCVLIVSASLERGPVMLGTRHFPATQTELAERIAAAALATIESA